MARIKNVVMAALVAIAIATAAAFALEPQGEKAPSASDAKQELLDLMHAWGKAACAIGRRDDGPTAGV